MYMNEKKENKITEMLKRNSRASLITLSDKSGVSITEVYDLIKQLDKKCTFTMVKNADTGFEKMRQILLLDGWHERTNGSVFWISEEISSFLKGGEVIRIRQEAYPDKEELEQFEENKEEQVIVNCHHCGRLLFKGTERQRRGRIIYCDKPECRGEPGDIA
jgi:DNA-binding Lrp family transcriptional regulator